MYGDSFITGVWSLGDLREVREDLGTRYEHYLGGNIRAKWVVGGGYWAGGI